MGKAARVDTFVFTSGLVCCCQVVVLVKDHCYGGEAFLSVGEEQLSLFVIGLELIGVWFICLQKLGVAWVSRTLANLGFGSMESWNGSVALFGI